MGLVLVVHPSYAGWQQASAQAEKRPLPHGWLHITLSWEGWKSLHQVLPGFPKTLPLGKGAVMCAMKTLKTP